jgi:hypothetical protein
MQLRPRVRSPVFSAEPLAVEQMCAGELGAEPGSAQALDRLAVARSRAVSGQGEIAERAYLAALSERVSRWLRRWRS